MPEQEQVKEAEQTNIDSFIDGTYQREKALNAELDYLHQTRHEIETLKADKMKTEKIEKVIQTYEGWHITEIETIERIKKIVRG